MGANWNGDCNGLHTSGSNLLQTAAHKILRVLLLHSFCTRAVRAAPLVQFIVTPTSSPDRMILIGAYFHIQRGHGYDSPL